MVHAPRAGTTHVAAGTRRETTKRDTSEPAATQRRPLRGRNALWSKRVVALLKALEKRAVKPPVKRHSRLIRPGFIFCWVLGIFIALMGGCQKQRRPSPGEIHAITKEFAAALKATAPADVRSEVSTSYQDSAGFDRINFTWRSDSISSSPAVVCTLLRAMNGLATRHHLSRDGPLESRQGLLYAYRRAGVITHMVHFHEKIDVNSTEAPPPQQNEAARQNETARLAIILDDLGNDLPAR